MRIARIGIATADLGSDGGVIDGRARVHWRDGARFPAAGDGSVLFIIYVDLHRLRSTRISKTLHLGRARSRGGLSRRAVLPIGWDKGVRGTRVGRSIASPRAQLLAVCGRGEQWENWLRRPSAQPGRASKRGSV